MTKKEKILQLVKFCGYHNDTKSGTRILIETRISRQAYNEAFGLVKKPAKMAFLVAVESAMEVKMNHTPLPWKVGGDLPYIIAITQPEYHCRLPETIICRGIKTGGQDWPYLDPTEYQANAEFIVKACNSHYELRNALKDLLYQCEHLKGELDGYPINDCVD